MQYKVLVKILGLITATGIVYSSAGSIVTSADEVSIPQSTEDEQYVEAEYLGGAAAAFEESLFAEEQPVLQAAGAIAALDDDLGLFDVWAGGELVESFETELPEEEAEPAEEITAVSEQEPLPSATPTPMPTPVPVPSVTPVLEPEKEAAATPTPSEVPTETPTPAETPTETPAPTEVPAPTEEPAPEEEEPAAGDESEEQSEDGAAKGAEVAAFACRFVGNPYVYGGTSLTDGADCSGFVMSVYKNFGVSLPRSSGDYPNAAYAVEDGLAGARPGDIMCYRGHVAIYIGDGQIVHAYNSRKGITITEVGYDTVIAVRRVFR